MGKQKHYDSTILPEYRKETSKLKKIVIASDILLVPSSIIRTFHYACKIRGGHFSVKNPVHILGYGSLLVLEGARLGVYYEILKSILR
jgi:hypothetical protein